MTGWGEVAGKIFNWLPKKEEYLKNDIEKIERQLKELQGKTSSKSSYSKYRRLLLRLERQKRKLYNRV